MRRFRPDRLLLVLCFAFRASSFSFLRLSPRKSRHPSKPNLYLSKGNLLKDTIAETEAVELGRTQLSHLFNFPLDDWQLQAGGEILLGHNVIVCAPTGSG